MASTTATRKSSVSRRSRLAPWAPALRASIIVRSSAPMEIAVDAKLQRVVKAVGLAAAADMLGVDKAQLSRCARGKDRISGELARRISDVEYVLERALRVMHPDEIGPWLTAPEPLLGNSTPLNALALQGAARITQALDALYAGVLV